MITRRLSAVMGALAATAGGACSTGDVALGTGQWAGTIDTVAGVVEVNNPATPIWGPEDAWRLEENLSIGVAEGDPNYQFSGIGDVEVDDQGRIYVLDWQERRISVYDASGTFVTAFGRQGGGPGEFENPSELFWKGDTLVVPDWRLNRLSYFDTSGNLLREARRSFLAGRFRVRADGRAWAQSGPSWGMSETDGISWLVLLDLEGGSADTVLSWDAQEGYILVRGEDWLTIRSRPYAPLLHWTASSRGTLYLARGVNYEVEIYSPAGERVRTIRRDRPRPLLTGVDRDSALSRLERFAESAGPRAPIFRKAISLPELKAATGELVLSDHGYLWVRVYTEHDLGGRIWEVFDPEGRFLGAVDMPARLRINRITRDVLYGILPDDLDVPCVKRYAIRRSA